MSSVAQKDFDSWFPKKKVKVGTREFTIRPFSLQEIEIVIDKLGGILDKLQNGVRFDELQDLFKDNIDAVKEIIVLVFKHDDITTETLPKMPAAVIFKMAQDIIDLNSDFFSEKTGINLPNQEEVPSSTPSKS